MLQWLIEPRSTSDSEYAERTMASSKPTYVGRIPSSDNGIVELESSGDDKSVDGIGGRHASFGQKKARTLSDRSSEVENGDTGVVEEAIDGGVEARSPADFAKYGCWHADKSAAVVGKCEDRSGPVFKNTALGGASKSIDGLRVEN